MSHHVITIIIHDDGEVQGDLDDEIAIQPWASSEFGGERLRGAQGAFSVLKQALSLIREMKDAAP